MTDLFEPSRVDIHSFCHDTQDLSCIETHMSWVFLTGKYAYKVKKPVNLGFADFSTLERRKYYCDRELKLNTTLAPELYEAIIPIGGTPEHPRFGATPAFEYAVKMVQFSQDDLLIQRLSAGRLTRTDVAALGRTVASIHTRADQADPTTVFGHVRSVVKPVADNYRDLKKRKLSPELQKRLERQCAFDFALLRKLRATLSGRHRHGRIRDCHGDLHLGNVLLKDGEIVPFDRLEFDPSLRWIDVMNEAAFPYMDLRYRDRDDLAFEYLNAYCEYYGDYDGLKVLPVYATYKAMIRAKVGACNDALNVQERLLEIESHIRCAEEISQPYEGRLVLMHGLSCSGKSRVSDELKLQLPAIRICADVERKRAAGLRRDEESHSGVGTGLYDNESTIANYRRLSNLARSTIAAGFNVIVDAAFLQSWQREMFFELASEIDSPLTIVDCQAPVDLLRRRLVDRATDRNSPSEADLSVLDWQLERAQALSAEERQHAIAIDTSVPLQSGILEREMGLRA